MLEDVAVVSAGAARAVAARKRVARVLYCMVKRMWGGKGLNRKRKSKAGRRFKYPFGHYSHGALSNLGTLRPGPRFLLPSRPF